MPKLGASRLGSTNTLVIPLTNLTSGSAGPYTTV
ncbi:hypothetical protein JOC24_003835 [Streptomyces sp. HB132]|nr:hypothetical protein [Streptomyces sp. HB132]